MGFRVYVSGFRVSGLRGSSVKDPTPKHEKRTTSPMPKILTPATFFSFPVNAPEGSRATHTFARNFTPASFVSDIRYYTVHICLYYIPGTEMTSIFEGQPPKTKPFPIKTRVIWVPGMYTISASLVFLTGILMV